MIDRLCDSLYSMVIDAKLKQYEIEEVFCVLSRKISKLCDGHTVRKVISKYKLKEYYYGDGNIQEKMSNHYLIWRGVWYCVYYDGYEDKFLEKTSNIFGIHKSDLEFVLEHLYQKDFSVIQEINHDPLVSFKRFKVEDLIEGIESKIKRLIYSLRYLYSHDQGISKEDYLSLAKIKALEGFRMYDGECDTIEEYQGKMLSVVNSFIKDEHHRMKDDKRIEIYGEGGYRLRILSLNHSFMEDSKEVTLLDTLSDTFSDIDDLYVKHFIKDVKKLCSYSVFKYVETILLGKSHGVDVKDKAYYRKIRAELGVTLDQTKKEIAHVFQTYNKKLI